MTFHIRYALMGVLIAFSVLTPKAHAYTNQWQWTNSVGSQTYNTKQEALNALHAASAQTALLTIEAGITAMDSGTAQYKYTAPPKAPDYTDWVYTVLDRHGAYQTFATEAAAATFMAGEISAVKPPMCNSVSVSPSGTWQPQYTPPDYGSNSDTRTYATNEQGYDAIPTPHCYSYSGTTQMWRQRTISCPTYYHFTSTAPYCADDDFGYVTGYPLECPKSGPSTTVGNPCDAATGDKSQTEPDYSSANLRFKRFYHSAILESHHALGYGWTHNFSARLILYGGQPQGLVRPEGHHDVLTWISGQYISMSGAGIHMEQNGSQWVAHLKDGSREIYDSGGELIQLIDQSGAVTTLNYSNGQLDSVVGPFGHGLQFSYTDGRITQVEDPAGETITYAYDSIGNLIEVVYQDGASKTYHYENSSFPHHLTGITDESNVRFATYDYDAMGRVISSEHAGGAGEVTIDYNEDDTVVTDAAGTVSTFEFTTDAYYSRRVASLDRNGQTQSYEIPSAGTDQQRRVTQTTDARGMVTVFTYDRDHLTSKTEAYGTALERTTSYEYNSEEDDLPTEIIEPSKVTTFTYNSAGNVLTKTITDSATSQNRTWTYTYNSSGQVLTINGPRTDVSDLTTYTYYNCTTADECGQVHTITNALSQTTTYNSYNAHGQPLQVTDSNGVVTTLTYDERLRLASRTTSGETTTYGYWPNGLLKKVTLADDSFLEYSYDDAQRLTQVEDSDGNRSEYTLDAMGNRTAEEVYDPSNALARIRTQVFNDLNQLWKQVGSASTTAVTTVFGYDDNGNLTSLNAPLSRSTANEYDVLNRLIEITDPGSGTTAFGYDDNDNLISVTDPRSLVTSYEYNGFGNITEITSPDSGMTTITYDSGGNLATRTDARSRTGTYAYDALNRVTSITYSDQTINFTYDAGTYGDGHLTGASDANHSIAWTYDALRRVTGKGQTVGGIMKSVGYGYTDGNLTSLVTPSGQTISYGYTEGRITSLTLNGSTTILEDVLYEPFGPVRQWTWGNSSIAVRVHNLDGLVTAVDSAGASSYEYDNAFRVAEIDDLDVSARTWTYGYDVLDRLNAAARTGLTIGYTYDANGNRLSQTGTQTATYSVASSSNRISSISGTPNRTYSYDAAGNTTGYGSYSYTYNDAGRMTAVTASSVTTSYVLNALGQRVKKSNSSITRYFVYDEAGHLIGEYDGSGNLVQETVWLGDIPVATLRPNGGGVSVFYVHSDHLNTPRRVSRPSDDVVVWRWDGDPFGTTAANQDPDGDSTNFVYNLRFPGQYYDAETGLSYNYFRDYDPATGRFVESDPIGLEGGVNTYLYAKANPISLIDPMGLKTCGSGRNEPLVPDNPFGFSFSGCCRQHDQCYDDCQGGLTKGQCDSGFTRCALGRCKRYTIPIQLACVTAAQSYSAALSTDEARRAFENARSKCCERARD